MKKTQEKQIKSTRKKTPETRPPPTIQKTQYTPKRPQENTPKIPIQTPISVNNSESLPPKIIKGILKKPKQDDGRQSVSPLEMSSYTPVRQDQPNERISGSKTPMSIVSAYHSLNQQHLATQTVDSAFEEYLKMQEEMAARGEIEESIKNLQEGLNERLGLYPSSDRGVWLISKLLAEIGIRLAVRCLNNEKVEKASQFLKLARKHTEPLPNSEWSSNLEWVMTRKNVFKNLALFHQKKEEWNKAFDCFKVALKLEKDLKENAANTSLTCAVILSKLNRYAESIEYAQSCMQQVEQQMSIDRARPLAEYKFLGNDQHRASEYDKQMTTYGISLHLLGKNLANLKYIKEAKVFLSKAQYVAINMLLKPKQELQLAITNDLNNLQKQYKNQLAMTKKANVEDIESSLMAIKTNIANTSYSQMADQQEQKALVGTVLNGPPVKMKQKEVVKGRKKKFEEDQSLDKEDEDDDKKTKDFLKRFQDDKRKQEMQALEAYRKKNAQDFDEKQQEFLDRQTQKFAKKEEANKRSQSVSKSLNDTSKDVKIPSNLEKAVNAGNRLSKTKQSQSQGPLGAKSDDEKSKRIKKADNNLAAEGAKLDRKGVKYSGEKGNKSFFSKRKQNIERVNEKLGFRQNDQESDEELGDWEGGNVKDEEIKRFDMLPPIKGYKVDSLISAAGERVLNKYEGYQSDASQKSKQMFNTQEAGTRKLLQTIEGKYRKKLPGSIKQDDQDSEEENSQIKEQNPQKNSQGQIRDIPTYIPPKKPDWRDGGGQSSSEGELPDPLKIIEKAKLGISSKNDDPSLKFSTIEGDQTQKEYKQEEEKQEVQAEQKEPKTVKNSTQRVTIFNKPPRATVPPALVPKKKTPEKDKPPVPADLKGKLSGSLGKQLGMTPKGSPRASPEPDSSLKTSQNESTTIKHNIRGKQASQKRSQDAKSKANQPAQYIPPSQRKKKHQDKIDEALWGDGEDSDERRQRRLQSMERLNQLSQPKPAQYVLVKEDNEDENEAELKRKSLMEQVGKGKQINFSDYVDRDVAYIKNNTILVNDSSKGKEFDTKLNNKSGLFSKQALKERQKDSKGEVKYIQDKKARKSMKNSNSPERNKSQKKQDANVPDYLKKARGINDDDDFGEYTNKNNFKNFLSRNTMTKKTSSKAYDSGLSRKITGLRNIRGGQSDNMLLGGNLSIKDLRNLENAAAAYIQKIVKGFFIRKWYLNWQVRKRLGVPFSGLEYQENGFLQHFHNQKQKLHELALVTPQIVELQDTYGVPRNKLVKIVKHNQAYRKRKEQLFDDPMKEEVGEVEKPKRFAKGATVEQLKKNLLNEFVAKGPKAYPQFTQLGSGIEHNDAGEELKPTTHLDQADLTAKELDLKVPQWRGNAYKYTLVNEAKEYMDKIAKSKSSQKQQDEQIPDDQQLQVAPKAQKQQFVSSLAAFASVHGVFKRTTEKPLIADEGDGDDIQTLLNKRRAVDEDEDYFPIEKYQEFSREAIVFYKRIGSTLVRWVVSAGNGFKKDKKFYLPIKIVGELESSRNTILVYLMNLELLKISKDINKNFDFETIWPFILYLFNNWVRHQVKLMSLLDSRPELKTIFAKEEPAMYEVQEFDKSLKEVKEDYNEMLNFSSEIEYDDRFEYDQYKTQNKNFDSLVDRSKPQDQRLKPIEQMQENRKKLMQQYKDKINMYEQLMQKMDEDQAMMNLDENGKPIKRVRIKLDDMYEPITTRKQNPFEYFLKMHFVPLPQTDQGQYKLMQNLQSLDYKGKQKHNGLIEDSISLMNEERRKRQGLPPMQILDYNCIDRAANKIKIIIDCLQVKRQLNGWCLIPRDVKETLMAKEWGLRRLKNIQLACKKEQISMEIFKRWGAHVMYPKPYNEKALYLQNQVLKAQNNSSRRHITVSQVYQQQQDEEILEFDQNTNRHRELDDELLVMQSARQTPRKLSQYNSTQYQVQQQSQNYNDEQQQEDEKQDAIGKLMDIQKTKQEVEDFLKEQEIIEQGVVRIEENSYILTIIFRKIKSNYENMRTLIDDRISRFERDQDDKAAGTINTRIDRMKSRHCEFVSLHPQVQRYDDENYNDIREMERIDIEQEKFNKLKTMYKSYAEIKVCSKISTTNWDDSFNLTWETLVQFYYRFRIKWSVTDFLTRKRFNAKERFTFYNFFANTLYIQECKIMIDLDRFDVENFKFNNIYLNLYDIKEEKRINKMLFYFDDLLEADFDESKFDYPVFPFYEDPKLVDNKITLNNKNIYFNYDPVDEDKSGQSLTVKIVEGNKKPELMIDEATKEYLKDPASIFNLTLSLYPPSGIYLGQVQLTSKDGYKSTFNLRIDYYKMGYSPILSIKAYNIICDDIFEIKVHDQKTIKDVIRICNQSQMKMVVNQLQSMLSINKKINGNYLKLNFNLRRDKSIYLGQNYINMMICNETLLRSMHRDSYRQFQGIVYFENLGGRMLVSVTEFEIDLEQLNYNFSEASLIHGNKHLEVKKPQPLSKDPSIPKKQFQRARLWKVNIFNIKETRNYEAVVSYEDLIDYYESEIFQFYQKNPNISKPNLVYLLQDYIRNLFIYRTRVGRILYWKLPHFKRPLDDSGEVVPVSSDQLHKLQLLKIYHQLQRQIDLQNRDEDNNALPFSLDQMKAKRQMREPPSLSLRNKLILEKELPIFARSDTKILKLTSSNQEIIVQVAKQFKSLLSTNYAIVTVILYPAMECWMWQIYFLKTQRTFSVTFYPSDLFNMDHQILNHSSIAQSKNPAAALWTELVKQADLYQNPQGDIVLLCQTFREPLKEILFQDHVYNENAMDIFFMEVTLKSYNNYVTDVRYSFYPLDMDTDELKEYTIGIRAYSLTRNIWIKDFQSLTEVVRILKKEKYLTQDTKLLYYSMLRDAATLLSHKIAFSDEAKTTEVKRKKLTYNIKDILNQRELFQQMQEEVREPPSPDKKKRSERKQRKGKVEEMGEEEGEEKGLKSEWRNQIELNKIIYQGVAAQNPIQLCTIIYNDVKDLFTYRLYRITDSSVYEKLLTSNEIMKTCAPNYQVMLKNNMGSHLGERIAEYYKTNLLVASLMNYYNIRH